MTPTVDQPLREMLGKGRVLSMKSIVRLILLAAALLGLAGLSPPEVAGCATARGKGEHVGIASETALIVWDEKAKTQHFIRRASFRTKVPYFGFLVPTPTKPQLAEVPDEVFVSLEEWTKPEEQTKTRYEEPLFFGCAGAKLSTADKAAGVEVLARQRVAGLDAVVLKATDGKKLREWLDEHGYDARPQLTDWVEPYIKQGWIITAFQIAKTQREEDRLSTKAVRMSFQADRPFFPYREPSDAKEDNQHRTRLLRVFVISGQRMEGTLEGGKSPWPGKAVWANPLSDEQHEALTGLLDSKQVSLRKGAWLTVFDDESSPRAGDSDLFFAPSADQSTLKRPPIIHYRVVYVPSPEEWLCLFFVLGAPLGLLLVILWRKRRRAAGAGGEQTP
jgi:hypothetical protein